MLRAFYMYTINVQSVICYEDAELKSPGIATHRRRAARPSTDTYYQKQTEKLNDV